jgi:acetyl/propionyl-CoA carboxylase alpha subunit
MATNVGFHRWLVENEIFLSGDYDTHFLDNHFTRDMLAPNEDEERVALVAASVHEWQRSLSVAIPERRVSTWKWFGTPAGAGNEKDGRRP